VYDKLSEVDIKCTSVVDLISTGPQTAAYEQAWKEQRKEKIEKRYIVKLVPNDFKLIPCTDKNDFQIFLYALQIYNWRLIKHGKY